MSLMCSWEENPLGFSFCIVKSFNPSNNLSIYAIITGGTSGWLVMRIRSTVSAMKIEKVYNNNVVQAKSSSGDEIILMGAGLGFQKRAGDELDESRIEKTFVLYDSDKLIFRSFIILCQKLRLTLC